MNPDRQDTPTLVHAYKSAPTIERARIIYSITEVDLFTWDGFQYVQVPPGGNIPQGVNLYIAGKVEPDTSNLQFTYQIGANPESADALGPLYMPPAGKHFSIGIGMVNTPNSNVLLRVKKKSGASVLATATYSGTTGP